MIFQEFLIIEQVFVGFLNLKNFINGKLKMFKKIFQYLLFVFSDKNQFYCGLDKYSCNWIIQFKKRQQYWIMQRNKIIRNAGYYKPYRTMIVLKKLVHWGDVCQKN